MSNQDLKRSHDDSSSSLDSNNTTKKRLLSAESTTVETELKAKHVMASVKEKLNKLSNKNFINQITSKIEKLDTKKKAIVGVIGRTGAGKSYLINTILGENLLPTGSVTACTSVITKIEASPSASNYTAEIELIPKEEWEKELQEPQANETEKDHREKIRALYGEDAVGKPFDKLKHHKRFSDIDELLFRKKIEIPPDTIENFSEEIRWYTQNLIAHPGKCYWPIVKTVTIKVPKSQDLPEHVVLIDFPGFGDYNQSRNNMWNMCMKSCTTLWVVAGIHRATSDLETWKILESNIKEMGRGGECQSITFICTKTDDICVNEYKRERRDDQQFLEKLAVSKSKKKFCILDRNEYAEKLIRNTFLQNTEVQKCFHQAEDILKVFTVSSQLYDEMDADESILNAEETEIPKVRKLLRDMNDGLSKESVKDFVTGAQGILSLIAGAKCNSIPQTETKYEVHDRLTKMFRQQVEIFQKDLKQLHVDFEQFLSKRADYAENHCVEKISEILEHIHHNTLKAVCRRNGYFKSPKNLVTNLNRELVDLMSDAETSFRDFFCKRKAGLSFSAVTDDFSIISDGLIKEFDGKAVSLHLVFLQTEEVELKKELGRKILKEHEALYDFLQDKIRKTMHSAYTEAAHTCGDCALKNMKSILLECIKNSKTTMFKSAKSDMLQRLQTLTNLITTELETQLKTSLDYSLIIPEGLPEVLPDVSDELKEMKALQDSVLAWN